MAAAQFKMSAEHYDELVKELDYLRTTRNDEVAEQLKEARSFGDLSENSEYDEAKNEQGKLHSKIAELENIIKNAVIVEKTDDSNTVGNGSKVTIHDFEYDEDVTYTMVGAQEANPLHGKISDDSPLGAALMGHTVGEEIEYHAPNGKLKVKILNIER